MTTDFWFRASLALLSLNAGLIHDLMMEYHPDRRKVTRLVGKWLFLGSAVLLVASLMDIYWTAAFVALLPIVSGAVARWYFPWRDRLEMLRDA